MPVKKSTNTTYRRDAKAGVIRRRMRGETTREIAEAEGLARNTVMRILSLPEVRAAVARSRGIFLGRAEEMSERLVQLALGETTKGNAKVLLNVLRGIGVLSTKLEMEETFPEERTYDFPKVAFFYKNGRWPTLEEAIEFDKTLEVEPMILASARVNPSDGKP
jgi:hypothetical protein